MTVSNGWLTAARVLAVLAFAFGVLGFAVTYAWVPTVLPEYQSGLLLCGLLAMGGIAMVAASRVARKESVASLINLAACSSMVVTLLVATSGHVVLRLWFTLVIHFS